MPLSNNPHSKRSRNYRANLSEEKLKEKREKDKFRKRQSRAGIKRISLSSRDGKVIPNLPSKLAERKVNKDIDIIVNEISDNITRTTEEIKLKELPTVITKIKDKAPRLTINTSGIILCDKLIEEVFKAGQKSNPDGKFPTKASVAQNINKIKRVYKTMFDKEMTCVKDQIKFLLDSKQVLTHISNHWKQVNSKAQYVSAISATIKYLKDFEEVYEKYYTPALKQYTILKTKKRDKNELGSLQAKNYLPWKDILRLKDEIVNHPNPENKARNMFLYALFTSIPPRRKSIAQRLHLTISNTEIQDKKIKEIYDTKKNWLVVAKNLQPKFIVMNNYKTYRTYGQYIINLRKDKEFNKKYGLGDLSLRKSARAYLIEEKVKEGEPVFRSSGGKIISHFTIIEDMMELFSNKRVGSTMFRISFATHLCTEIKTTTEQEKLIAEKMGTSSTILNESYCKRGELFMKAQKSEAKD